MTTKNIIDPINMSTEIRELNDDELATVSGGAVILQIAFKPAETMKELYQDWADLGNMLKNNYANHPR